MAAGRCHRGWEGAVGTSCALRLHHSLQASDCTESETTVPASPFYREHGTFAFSDLVYPPLKVTSCLFFSVLQLYSLPFSPARSAP